MSDHLSDEDLDRWDFDAVVAPHQPDYDSVGGCVCGESYPCTTRLLVAEVRRLRAGIRAHRDTCGAAGAPVTCRQVHDYGQCDVSDAVLWALLDDQEDDR